MSAVTRFAARDPGPSARVAGFIAHLRANGLKLGVRETEAALQALTTVCAADIAETRLALRAVCTGCGEEATRFDALFDGYWRDGGRVRSRVAVNSSMPSPHVHAARRGAETPGGGRGTPDAPDSGDEETESGGEGRLVASSVRNLARTDLRHLVTPEDIAEAERVARQLGAALRDRRSRRRRMAKRGSEIDFRRVVRRSLARGGEPIELPKRERPDRSVRLVALCDVSGSMQIYAKVFLSFVAGLMRADDSADAFLFHTRLVRISEALREPDPLKAVARMSLMADGFGGGSKIGAALAQFAQTHARRCVNSRTVVLILSDGYDTDPPAQMAEALAAIRRRGARIVWLNPLKGWDGYAPVAAGMAAALPHLDLFAPAATLDDLAALEGDLSRL